MHHTSYRTEINSSSWANEKFLGQDISAVYQGALRRGTILLYEDLLLIIHPICGRNSQCEYWLWQALLSSVDSDSPESQPDLSKTVWAEVGEGLTDWLPTPDRSEPIPSNNASGRTHIFETYTLLPRSFHVSVTTTRCIYKQSHKVIHMQFTCLAWMLMKKTIKRYINGENKRIWTTRGVFVWEPSRRNRVKECGHYGKLV